MGETVATIRVGERGAVAVARLLELRARPGENRDTHLGRVRVLAGDPDIGDALSAAATLYGHATVARTLGLPVGLVLASAAPALGTDPIRATARRHSCQACDRQVRPGAHDGLCGICRRQREAAENAERQRFAHAARHPTRPILTPLPRAA